jgi:hypothetical protein
MGILFRLMVIAMLAAFAGVADAQERVIMAGLDNRMGSTLNRAPDTCKWTIEQRRRETNYVLERLIVPDPLIWQIENVRYANMFRAKVACVDQWTEEYVWSDWSYWVYAGPERDIDGDGAMGLSDLVILRAAWQSVEGDGRYDARADLDDNGGVGARDIGLMRAVWNRRLVGNRWEK